MIPVGTLLQINERHHAYRIIVLERFPIFFNDKQTWHYNLHFWRDGVDMGTLAFEEIELKKLINKGEIKILSEG